MTFKKYTIVFALPLAFVALAVAVYIGQLSSVVNDNLMTSVDEISRHDVQTIEGSLEDTYDRLDAVMERLDVYDVESILQLQEQLNLETASSPTFNAIYLLERGGTLISSTYVQFEPEEQNYDQIVRDHGKQFAILYDDVNGELETTKESLIYGVRLDESVVVDGYEFVAILGRTDLSTIRNQLLIESFDGRGISSVVNEKGYYIVSASPATDLAGRDNLYAMLEEGILEEGVTIQDVRQNISEGKSFTINCVNAAGEELVMSFAPVEGTNWSFIMTVPAAVFQERFAPFIAMTVGMLAAVLVMVAVMLVLLYRSMKQSVLANAQAVARAEFLSNMSHEIRTPLNGIVGLNHLMERHIDDTEAMAGYVKKLDKTAHYLLSLVNDILDVSKLQAGKIDLVDEPFNFNLLIENLCLMEREPLNEKRINFKRDIEEIKNPHLIGDEVRIAQVLMNVLSNAIKFTPEEGYITLRASQVISADGARSIVTVSIADTGCGMSPEFQKHIFDSFTQERNKNSESQKGTGLGMSISHLLMESMGGSISVESDLGSGSCFTIMFNLDIDQSPSEKEDTDNTAEMQGESVCANRQAPNQEKDTQACCPCTVLVAEDNELNAEIITSILGEEGYQTLVASNGKEALELFAASPENSIDIILMDAQMPVMDGFESAQAIRGLPRQDAQTVRIFACTASTFAEDKERALQCGMDDFLAKPLEVDNALKKLQAVRNEKQGGEGHEESTAQ